MKFEKKIGEKYLLYILEGDIRTAESMEDLNTEFENFIEKENQNVVFDLSGMKFMNSDGLNFMVRVLTALRAKNGELYLTNLPEKFSNLMLITKLNSIFTIYNSNEEVLTLIESNDLSPSDINEEE